MKKPANLNDHGPESGRGTGGTSRVKRAHADESNSHILQDPIASEKDEVKQAEERLRKTKEKQKNKDGKM